MGKLICARAGAAITAIARLQLPRPKMAIRRVGEKAFNLVMASPQAPSSPMGLASF
jgi:hypothetical protein